MSIINSQPRIGAAGQSTGFKIERSLRFNSADSAYLNRTPASAGNRRTWTWSGWIKRNSLGSTQYIFAGGQTTSVRFESDDTINFYSFSSAYDARINTSQVFRDVGAWYHIVAVFDTGSATTTLTGSSTDRMRLYVNGTQVSNFSATVVPTQNFQGYINNNEPHMLNARYNGSYVDTNGNWYLTEVNFIDGSAKVPGDFGETDTDTGVWKPKAYSGSYGTNGFYLKFADNSGTTSTTLGKDSSGNSNNWTPNNFSVTAGSGNDSLVDTPTPYGTDTGAGGEVRGNYATLNPLDNGGLTLSNGNITVARSASGWLTCRSTFGMSSGKWYWEYSDIYTGTSDWATPGIAKSTAALNGQLGADSSGWIYIFNGNKYTNSTQTSYGATWNGSNVIGVAFDADAGTLTFYKDGVSQGTAFSSLTSGPYFPAISMSAASGTLTSNVNFGQRPFAYTAPSGFKALCTTNLPTPTIGATASTQAGKYFNTMLYTGNGSAPRGITGVGFQPDFVWTQCRSNVSDPALVDSVRGGTKLLFSDLPNSEYTGTWINSFDSDGYTIGDTGSSFNSNGRTYVSWNWKANGSGASNTSGTITSTVSANTTAGFSIVTYTGNATAGATIGHGLGATPSMIIVKDRVATSGAREWVVYHSSLGNTKAVFLSTTGAAYTGTNLWNNTSPTSAVFTVGNSSEGTNGSGNAMLAYCFAPIAGYSAFGSYTGNGSTDGPMIFTGFRPAWVLFKKTSASGIDWMVFDSKRNTYNAVNNRLFPSLSNAEVAGAPVDFTSNGFKIRENNSYHNDSGATYIYAAFAEVPFKYSLAR